LFDGVLKKGKEKAVHTVNSRAASVITLKYFIFVLSDSAAKI
jgi:hypothetical protein